VHGANSVGFGFAASAPTAPLRARWISGPTFRIFACACPTAPKSTYSCRLPGRHNVMNALAAAAAAHAAGAGADEIRAGLAAATAVRGRLNILAGRNGARVIDDSYNANPASVRAALDYLAALPGQTRAGAWRHGRAWLPRPPRCTGKSASSQTAAAIALIAVGELAAMQRPASGRL
jgi:hypothetical protein